MAGLRERKKARTRTAIHDAALRLFAERGYEATTVADIAEAADVSRATFFSYYASKDDVVFGDAPQAAEALEAMLADLPDGVGTVQAVREWLRTLAGWLDDDRLPLQRRLVVEHPSVAARRHRIYARFEEIITTALARELESELAARLTAASLIAALSSVETAAAQRTEASGRALSSEEVDQLLDATMAFIDGGLARVKGGSPRVTPSRSA